MDTFADTVVAYDLPAAQQTAAILVAAKAAGRPMSLADAQIAGIRRGSAHDLATGNVDDFSTVSRLTLTNPFQQ